MPLRLLIVAPFFLMMETSCDPESSRCGPSSALVTRVIDGDTIELENGERIRYLLIDTPEISGDTPDCFGPEATETNRSIVENKEVTLRYDEQCRDRFDRLLAYVSVEGRDVNATMIERGFACVLYIPPNGEDRIDLYNSLQSETMSDGRGMWGACEEVSCL